MLQPEPEGGSDGKAVRHGVIRQWGTKVTQGLDRGFTISNRVFYKELEKGTYKIVEMNIVKEQFLT